MLERFAFVATLPAANLQRARAWYRDKLGLDPIREYPGGLIYEAGSGELEIYETGFAGKAEHTLGSWVVEDIEAVVGELRSRGVEFEEYDLPGLKTEDGIATLAHERAAWFKDSEGNILALGQRSSPS